MGNSASCSRPRASAMEEWNCKEAGAAAATTLPSASTASCASSFEKTVLLHDWWLIKVKDDSSRPRLAVGGMATTGKAVRIFKSAPIVKRYDGYTLETADGITVRIQGLINTSRMHQNGFPTEACNHFRIGFPYSWKDYADRYFRTDTESNGRSTCASDIHKCSMDPGSTSNYFPLCSKEFPVGRVIDRLNSICKKIVDGAQTSTDTTQNVSDDNHNSESTNGMITQMNHIIDENSNAVEENAYAATKIDALGLNSPLDGQKESNNHVSAMNVNRPLEEITGFQRKSLATVVTDRDNEKPISDDAVGVVKDMNESTCCINASPTADFWAKDLLSKSPPENWKESESMAPREDHPTKEAELVVCLSESAFMSHESDVEVRNLPGVQLQMDLLNSASSDAACIAKRNTNSLRNRYVNSSSISVSQNCAGMSPNQGESGLINHLDGAKVAMTEVSGEPICTETNEMHLEVSGATGNHSQIAVKNILSHEGHRFDEKNVGSVASMLATSTGTPTKQVATMYEKISPRSSMKDVGGKLSCYLKSAAKEPSSVLVNVNQPREHGEPSLIDVTTMDLSSERVLVECSYNETNDLQIENSVKLMGCASDFVKSPPNMSINVEENIICSPHVGMTMSEPPKKQFSLRRSERLLKLKTSVEDSQRSLEHNKRNMNQIGSKSMSNGIRVGQSSTLSMNKGTTMTEGSHPKSGHVHAVVARKLNFSSHKSFHSCDVTSVEGILHTGLEGNNISSKKRNAKAIQENLQKSQASYIGYSQNNLNHSRSKSQSAADPGKNRVLPSSDGHGSMNSGNVVRDSHDMTEDRIEADMQNLVMPTREQNISDVVINYVSGHAKEARQTDAHVDIQPNDDKSSGDAAKKSRQKPRFARQGGKSPPLTRQQTKRLSFASPELLNFKRSRSGRLLVPTLSNWCQQIHYGMDGSVAGIVTGVDATKWDHRDCMGPRGLLSTIFTNVEASLPAFPLAVNVLLLLKSLVSCSAPLLGCSRLQM